MLVSLAFERGARLNGDRRWEGEGAAEMSSRWMVEEEMKACSVWRAGEGMGGKNQYVPVHINRLQQVLGNVCCCIVPAPRLGKAGERLSYFSPARWANAFAL